MANEKDFRGTDIVNEQYQRAAEYITSGVSSEFGGLIGALLNPECSYSARVESPLEAVFVIWWVAMVKLFPYAGQILDLRSQNEIVVDDQTYRIDFVLDPVNEELKNLMRKYQIEFSKIAVELDGHAFHEKTKEQVTYRNARDRALQKAGWQVFHYSFSEVMRDPMACVKEVELCGRRAYWNVERRLHEHMTTEEHLSLVLAQ